MIPDASRSANPHLQMIRLIEGDITTQDTDAIVTIVPQSLEWKGKLNTAIQEASGTSIADYIAEHIYRPDAGDIYAIPGFNLPAKHIIIAVVPVWKDDFDRMDKHLALAARKAITLAKCLVVKSVSFPLLAAGQDDFPKAKAARLILQGIMQKLDDRIDEVRMVCHSPEGTKATRERLWSMGWRD